MMDVLMVTGYKSAMEVVCLRLLVIDERPRMPTARRVANGALARKISKSGSPVSAIPSNNPRPRVTKAKKGGT